MKKHVMLVIKNIDKILHKTLGKKNFYVEQIKENVLLNPMTFTREDKYLISITNRTYSVTLTLDRTPIENENLYYKLYSSTGHHSYLRLEQIRNIDKFLDEIRLVGIH